MGEAGAAFDPLLQLQLKLPSPLPGPTKSKPRRSLLSSLTIAWGAGIVDGVGGALGAGAIAAGAGGAGGGGGAIDTLNPGTLVLGGGDAADGGADGAAGALLAGSFSLPPRPDGPAVGPVWVPMPSMPLKSVECPFGSLLLMGSLSA